VQDILIVGDNPYMIENITKELESRYDCRLIRLTGGYTNITFLMEGTEPLLVAKVTSLLNHDTLNEVNCLKLLKESGVSPVVHDVLEISNMRIILMDYRHGVNGQSILDSGDLELAQTLYKRFGHFLASQIHTKSFNSNQKGIRKSNAEQLKASKLNVEFVPDDLVRQSSILLSDLDDNEQKWVLTHGDYGSHNILFEEENNLNVLDWEWAEWGNPLNDVAWVIWFTKLHYSELAHILNRAFINEYISYNPITISPQQLKICCVYKVWNIIYRVRYSPTDVQAEWIRRLDWTLNIDFSDEFNNLCTNT
jgi:aminoglycoside phosphotransferase